MIRLRPVLFAVFIVQIAATASAGDGPKPLVKDLKNPQSVVATLDGRVFITVAGELKKKGDGELLLVKDGKVTTFCRGLDDPRGVAAFQQWLFVADTERVWKIDQNGKAQPILPPAKARNRFVDLRDIVVDPESGIIYVTDAGSDNGMAAGICRITPGGQVRPVTIAGKSIPLKKPRGIVMDGASFLLVADGETGSIHRIGTFGGPTQRIAENLDALSGLAWDMYGRLYGSQLNGKMFGIARPGLAPVELKSKVQTAPDLCYSETHKALLVVDDKAGAVYMTPMTIPGYEVDMSPLPLKTELAFPNLKWTGWTGETPQGLVEPLRPIVLTHAGDGSNRVFVATQHGVIHVFPNDQNVDKTKIFLDIQNKVSYNDNQNEEGFLGLAFHPNYKQNGEFFVFYTLREPKLTNVLSRFRVSKDNPDRADPQSEEILLRIKRPFWNHDGGTIVFGPDGYLYVALGDGGAANDPFNNGQNLKTLLSSVLRIDVNRKDPGLEYAIPKDNPFVGRADARPEIWAYGLRNVWRMAFDRETNELWAGEVGQNLFEEINILTKGGNYGWRLRESFHPFGTNGAGVRKDLIDPIWEYHHDIGKSITGGLVYRGKRLPSLFGHYLYADYVSTKIWALQYDHQNKKVTANRLIQDDGKPILSFGEDEQGEAYLLTYSITGQGIYRIAPAAAAVEQRRQAP